MLMHPRTRPQTSQKREKLMNRSWVSVASWFMFTSFHLATSECLKSTCGSSVYGFSKSKVLVQYEKGWKFDVFQCAAKKCKGHGTVHWYLDSKDRTATSNLKTHALKCFGTDAVNAAANNTQSHGRDGTIFTAFAHPGQQYHTMLSLRRKMSKIIMLSTCFSSWHDFVSAQIARWCTESNWPLKIVTDWAFAVLMKSGHFGTTIPSPMTVSWDIKSAFERCREHIDHILKACLGSQVLFCYLHSTIGTFGSCSLQYWCLDFSKPQGFRCLDCPSSPWGTCSMFPPQHCWSSWGSSSTVAFLSGNLPVTTSLILGRHLQESFSECSLRMGSTTR